MGPRKLLVASIGVATVSYVAATASCGGQTTASSSTDAAQTDDGPGQSSSGASGGTSYGSSGGSSSGFIVGMLVPSGRM